METPFTLRTINPFGSQIIYRFTVITLNLVTLVIKAKFLATPTSIMNILPKSDLRP